MRLPQFRYVRPHTVAEASSFLHEHQPKATVLAGGTALMVNLGQRLIEPDYILGLKNIPDLDYIHRDKDSTLKIGTLTTVYDLARSPLVTEQYPVLAQAAGAMAMPAIQQMATVGGNLCQDTRCIYYNQSQFWRQARPPCFKRGGDICHAVKGGQRCLAVYQGDLAPALLALEASVKVARKDGERVMPLGELFTGKGDIPVRLEPDEFITEIQVPPLPENAFGSYQKLRIREAIDFPLTSVAAVLEIDGDNICRRARLVLGARPFQLAAVPLKRHRSLVLVLMGDDQPSAVLFLEEEGRTVVGLGEMIRPDLPQRVDIKGYDAMELSGANAGLHTASIVRGEVGDAVNDDTTLGVELDAQIRSRIDTVRVLLCENRLSQRYNCGQEDQAYHHRFTAPRSHPSPGTCICPHS